jgi:DNA replication protein DnaC
MGISNTQYRDIMFHYDQTRMENQRLLDTRHDELYKKIPELKEIHDKIVELSVEQAKAELLNPERAHEQHKAYTKEKNALLDRKAEILAENGYPDDYLNPIYTCTSCQDTGYINGRPCSCFQQAKLDALYENSNLMDVLEQENFSTFCEDYYDDTTVHENLSITPRENIRRIKSVCQSFIRHFNDSYENLLFYGPTGVGKTFLTHCIAKELLDSSHTVVYLTSLQLFDMLEKNKFHKDDPYTTNEQISYILNCDLLIIDDLGTELSNSFTISQLYYFIEERHNNQRSTIISTNLSFSDLRERYSERIFSRFTGYYDFKQIVGNDIRIQKAFTKKH